MTEAVTVMLWYISGAGSPSFTLIKGPLNEFVVGSGGVLASDVKNVKNNNFFASMKSRDKLSCAELRNRRDGKSDPKHRLQSYGLG